MVLKDLCIPLSFPTIIYCDNLGAICFASNPMFHTRTKYVKVDVHFIHGKVQNCDISTIDQLANLFTKGLSSSRFCLLRDKLMVYKPSFTCGGILM